jgi:hypothetical protein
MHTELSPRDPVSGSPIRLSQCAPRPNALRGAPPAQSSWGTSCAIRTIPWRADARFKRRDVSRGTVSIGHAPVLMEDQLEAASDGYSPQRSQPEVHRYTDMTEGAPVAGVRLSGCRCEPFRRHPCSDWAWDIQTIHLRSGSRRPALHTLSGAEVQAVGV